jgi:uncharacterized protein (DUF433 family)
MGTIQVISRVPSHITLDENGVARIDGTRMKVIHVAKERYGHNATVEQMHEAWPHLTLAQIHAALSYYYDHKAEIDAEIERELAEDQRQLAAARENESPLRKKLRDLGHLE